RSRSARCGDAAEPDRAADARGLVPGDRAHGRGRRGRGRARLQAHRRRRRRLRDRARARTRSRSRRDVGDGRAAQLRHRGRRVSTKRNRAIAEARTNIALVKYWGKRDLALNLPAVGSLSMTLEGLSTRTEVRFDPSLAADSLELNGAVESGNAL